MADPQHVEWFLEGVRSWNRRRKKTKFVPNLAGEDLTALFELAGRLRSDGRIPLFRVNLAWANLRGAVLREANLGEANLQAADLADANLEATSLGGADLRQANLGEAKLLGAYLRRANLWRANISGADLRQANLEEAVMQGANFWKTRVLGANLSLVNVTTIGVSTAGSYHAGSTEYTDLSRTSRLLQSQIETMRGDSGTILPDHLTRPAHWPELDGIHATPRNGAQTESSSPASKTGVAPEPPGGSPYVLQFRKRPLAEIRKALLADHTTPAALAQYMVDQIQRQIASHEMVPKPNTEEGLAAWHKDAMLLQEMLVTVQHLHAALPANAPERISDRKAKTIKDLLVQMAGQVQAAITYLDNDTGTYGNFWKIGLIGTAVQVLAVFGVSMPIAAPIAAAVIGANTLRVLVGKAKS